MLKKPSLISKDGTACCRMFVHCKKCFSRNGEIHDAGKGQIPGRAKSLGGQVVIRLDIHVEQQKGKYLPVGKAEPIGLSRKVAN